MQTHHHQRTQQLVIVLVATVALHAACKKQEPVVIDARPQSEDLIAEPANLKESPISPAPTGSSLPVVSPAPHSGEEPTIELSGVVRIGPSGKPRYPVSVIIASGDCASPDSRLLRRVPLSDTDSFYAVVMADPGEKLSVCVASEPAPGLPTPVWVRSDPMTVGTASEQSFSNLSLVLRSAEPKTFAVKARSK